MAVEYSASYLDSYYWQIYHLFGDPSMMPWLSQAKEMPLAYSGADEGSSLVYVTTAPYAYLAVTDSDNVLVGATLADQEGRATVVCAVPIEQGNMKLSSIAQNYKPLIMTINQNEGIGGAQARMNANTVALFPNPTAGELTVESDVATEAWLFSATGKLVMQAALLAGTNRIDLSHLPQGVYILKTSLGASRKVVRY